MAVSPSSTSQHLLIFPYPGQGHILPLLKFTHQLASNGFTLTVLVTPKNLSILDPLLSDHPSIQTLVLPLPPHPKLPSGVENVKDIGNHGNSLIMLALRKLRDPIFQWFNSHPSPPVAIISDFFLGWTKHLADDLRIPRIVFYTSGAFTVNALNYGLRHSDTIQNVSSSSIIELTDLPKSPSFKKEHLPSIVKLFDGSNPEWVLLKGDAMANTSSWAAVFNSFETLEREHLDHLRKLRSDEEYVFGVGPLNIVELKTGHKQNPIGDSSPDVLTWLDRCPDDSVLYVCFGSQKQLNKQQMESVALGLEKSGVRFVWVVKTINQTDGGADYIPVGFEERVSDLGIVVKEWAPQVPILNHRAVGGFLSHCGWNSILESIAAGVMILSWPMEADQFINARLLSDMGVAVAVSEGANSVPDSDELGKLIAKSMSEESAEKMKAKELRKEALDAVKTNGSSWIGMNKLINKLSQIPTTQPRRVGHAPVDR